VHIVESWVLTIEVTKEPSSQEILILCILGITLHEPLELLIAIEATHFEHPLPHLLIGSIGKVGNPLRKIASLCLLAQNRFNGIGILLKQGKKLLKPPLIVHPVKGARPEAELLAVIKESNEPIMLRVMKPF